MQFIYSGVDKIGNKQKGKLEAGTEREVIDYLRSNNITPLTIRKETKTTSLFTSSHARTSDIVIFTRQLASMIQTGLTLIESLKILEKQITTPTMHAIIMDLISQISEGTPFSDALETHKDSFSNVYIALIRAAEKGGVLDKVLARLADNLEKSDELQRRVKGALIYPSIVVVGMLVVVVIMNLFVIPQLGNLYENLNLELPLSTRIVLGISNVFTTFWPIMVIIFIALFFGFKRFEKTPTGIRVIDKVKIKAPVIGPIVVLSTLDETTRTLSLMISSGASIIESLQITANVANNYWYKSAVLSASTLVEKGLSLSDALSNQKIFPPMVIQMTKVGESTGGMDTSLAKISEYFERDLDIRIKTLTTAIEPILIITLGISVAFLILSVITPIYGLISQIQ
jgi:type IV pilus assembly protein PilC